jgi:carbamoyltransferase
MNKIEAVQHIIDGKIVAIFQGQSEWGPRALGNRSILFDPRNPDAKDIVNKVKRREWYRPFAGTIMLEHAKDYFEMWPIKESPYMSYAIPAKQRAKELVPGIIHADGTCRIQTVTREQNKHFYELIEEFYKQTGIPVLFNTSFNLAGEPLVETLEDAENTVNRSDINYLYKPETL